MNDESTIYFVADRLEGGDWSEAVGNLAFLPQTPIYSWYEPNPQSLIEAGHEEPIICFCEGRPKIPNGVTWSRLMLFYSNGALTLIPAGNAWRYFYWQTDPFDEGTPLDNLQKIKPRTALLKTQNNLKSQYGIQATAPFPKDTDDTRTDPTIVEYRRHGTCIAWTLINQEATHGQGNS